MGIFDNIVETKASRSANYTRPGHYWCIINGVKEGETRNKDGFVAIEMTTIHRFEEQCFPDSIAPDGSTVLGSHKIGEDHTHMMLTKHDSFLGNFKQFLVGASGTPEHEITPEDATYVISDEQPLAGYIVEVTAKTIKTRRGTDFTKIEYERQISPTQIKNTLTPERIERFFPGDMLDKMIAAESAA
jgi:hypothetical protein